LCVCRCMYRSNVARGTSTRNLKGRSTGQARYEFSSLYHEATLCAIENDLCDGNPGVLFLAPHEQELVESHLLTRAPRPHSHSSTITAQRATDRWIVHSKVAVPTTVSQSALSLASARVTHQERAAAATRASAASSSSFEYVWYFGWFFFPGT